MFDLFISLIFEGFFFFSCYSLKGFLVFSRCLKNAPVTSCYVIFLNLSQFIHFIRLFHTLSFPSLFLKSDHNFLLLLQRSLPLIVSLQFSWSWYKTCFVFVFFPFLGTSSLQRAVMFPCSHFGIVYGPPHDLPSVFDLLRNQQSNAVNSSNSTSSVFLLLVYPPVPFASPRCT